MYLTPIQHVRRRAATALTDIRLHHAVVDAPDDVQTHAAVQVHGARHRLEDVAKSLGDLDVLALVVLVVVSVAELSDAANETTHTVMLRRVAILSQVHVRVVRVVPQA